MFASLAESTRSRRHRGPGNAHSLALPGLLALLGASLSPTAALAHKPPMVSLDIKIDDEQLVCDALVMHELPAAIAALPAGPPTLFDELPPMQIGPDPEDAGSIDGALTVDAAVVDAGLIDAGATDSGRPADATTSDAVPGDADAIDGAPIEGAAAVEAFLRERFTVRVDGVEVRPLLQSHMLIQNPDPSVDMTFLNGSMVIGLKGKPRQINFGWRIFDHPREYQGPTVALRVSGYGLDENFTLTEETPEAIWYPPQIAAAADLPPESPSLSLPLASLLALLGMLWLLLRERRASPQPVAAWTYLAVGAVLALVLLPIARVELSPDAWLGPPLSAPQARAIFEALHRNVYRAFDYKNESDVYDALAESVEGPLLDQLYGEVYESLVRTDEIGAIGRVKAVRVIASEVAFPEGQRGDRLQVRCHWRISGMLKHWGHSHVRSSEYYAWYSLRRSDGRWRISAVDMLDQQRVAAQGTIVTKDEPVPDPAGEEP